MSFFAFFNAMPWLPRQSIAELFLVSLILLMTCVDMERRKRFILAVIFSASVVVSHYGVTYIWLSAILAVWLVFLFREVRSATSMSPAAIVAFTLSLVAPLLVVWTYGLTFTWLFCVPLGALLLLSAKVRQTLPFWGALVALTLAVGLPWYAIHHYGDSHLWLLCLPLAPFAYLIARVKNNTVLTSTALVVLTFAMASCWYTFVADGAAYNEIAYIDGNINEALGSQHAFSAETTDPDIGKAFGTSVVQAGFWHALGQAWVILTEFLVAVGLLYAL